MFVVNVIGHQVEQLMTQIITCSGVWGFDCTSVPDGGDNTFDACDSETGTYEAITGLKLNATTVGMGDTILVHVKRQVLLMMQMINKLLIEIPRRENGNKYNYGQLLGMQKHGTPSLFQLMMFLVSIK